MGLIFKLNLNSIKEKLLKSAEKRVENTAHKVFIDLRLYSPVDTGTYQSQHIYKGIHREGNKIIAIIENQGEYSERVEKGFRTRPVNWHLINLGQIYNAIGAGTYAKAVAKNKDIY